MPLSTQSGDTLPRSAYAGRRATVMGLGRFGGGIGVVRFLARQGAVVTVTDLQSAEQLADPLRQIAGLPVVECVLGRHREADFAQAELVVASPAVRPDHPLLEAARRAGVDVTTEVGLFWRHCAAPIIGVTGTVGKSTTAAMIHHLLAENGRRSWLGGNIGGSLLDALPEIGPSDVVVLELSSFQLMYLDREGRSPHIAVVTNFAPNHLDWHRSLEEYRGAKQAILRHQGPDDTAILPAWEPCLADWGGPGRRVAPDVEEQQLSASCRLHLPGGHNRRNATLAIAAACAAGVEREAALRALDSFRGLPHRLEFLGEHRGRRFFDDSKATTPEAAIAALQAFDAPPIVLAGGSDKRVDLQPFARELALRAKAAALMGETAAPLDRLLAAIPHPQPPRCVAADFPTAFNWAVAQSSPGDIILLSPGCASFGWFRDYADRGEQFRKLVEGLGQ